jgi:ribosomal protein S18 acetylase RimI-like enzyme
VSVRRAGEPDAGRLAQLHADRITEGFLPTLGPAFLTRLYRRVVRSHGAFAFVEDEDGRVVGFAAAAVDTGHLFREFLVRDGLAAGLAATPRLLRSWRRILETLRYPSRQVEQDLPSAEILAVAVDESAGGRGVGRRVVDAATRELAARGVTAVKVVTSADNAASLRMYAASGFTTAAHIEVHDGAPSEVLVWNSSSR